MKRYKIYGFNVISEIELNCYRGDFESEDICIKFVDSEKEEELKEEFNRQRGKSKKLMRFFFQDNKLRFYVLYGTNIYIAREDCIDIEYVKLYILGTAFSILLMQRGIFPLHGSTINLNNKGLIIVGDCGSGKSSLASGFVKEGWKIVSDDVSLINTDMKVPHVFPSYPSQKIWENTAKKFDIDITNAVKIINRDKKYYIDDETRFLNKTSPISAVVEIEPCECEEVSIERTNSSQALSILIKNTFRFDLINILKLSREHLEYTSNLCNYIQVYKIRRPKKEFTVSEQIDLINKCILLKEERIV